MMTNELPLYHQAGKIIFGSWWWLLCAACAGDSDSLEEAGHRGLVATEQLDVVQGPAGCLILSALHCLVPLLMHPQLERAKETLLCFQSPRHGNCTELFLKNPRLCP